jgi:hypothetical protein
MFQLCGVDVYLRSESIPDVPREHGRFKLIFISNRGTKVWPAANAGIQSDDWPRCRYESEASVTDAEVEELIRVLSEGGFHWTKCQKLYINNEGERAYSQPY